ncbi:peptidoglycan DD-metalloendopeptidase family protein [Streptomyces sp. NPDC004393]|uniref:peptidoglycan DD-metalloendopeptidase family protein n=1 Tax=Streptomyces sp. NPDC004533 TaxID=3154278 RepID=UPI0033ABE9F5
MFVPLLLGAVAVNPAWSATSGGGNGAAGDGADTGLSGRVARLYADSAAVTRQYDTGRQEAAKQRAIAGRDEKLLTHEHGLIAALHQDLGRVARAQYRQGGGLPYSAQTLLPDSAKELIASQSTLARLDLAVANAVIRSRLTEAGLAAERAQASARWRALQQRNGELVARKQALEAKLEQARWALQSQANVSAASGTCRAAVRLDLPGRKTGHPWVAPVEAYRLSAGFGSGGDHWSHGHTGQDFAVPIGTPVRAVGSGQVVRVKCGGAFGMEVVIRHPGGYCTQYAHLAAVTVDPGDRVRTGQLIAQSGTTGNSTGPHLHFEVRSTPEWGSGIDPVPWLAAHGVRLVRPSAAR